MKKRSYICSFLIFLTVCACTNSGVMKDGIHEAHYEGSDQLKQLLEIKNGKKNGFAKEFYRNGNLKKYQHYLNDTLNDSSIYYHPNGKISNLQFYKNNQKHGCWKDFNKDGVLIQEINFKNGLFDGVSVKYSYRTNRVLYRVNYKEGTKEGYEEKFYPNGKPQSKVSYYNGWQCQGLQEWNENGTPIKHEMKISVTEKNEVNLNNTLKYIITLSDPNPSDYVYRVYDPKDSCVSNTALLEKQNNVHVLEFYVGKGGFVMENVTIVAKRKTLMGNTFMKLKTFNAAANHY